jgi:hypothetical protein
VGGGVSDDKPLVWFERPPMPALVLRVQIETSEPEFYIEAESDEDEQALRCWLQTKPSAIADLPAELADLLDELQEAA